MSTAIGVSVDGERVPVARARVDQAVRSVLRGEGVREAMISVAFIGRPAMRALNRRHLGRNGDTDVIAFGFRRGARSAATVGDIYICAEVARANAKVNSVPVGEELLRLVVHGTLHVLGHDHPESDARTRSPMWKKQERYIARIRRRTR